jgi:hypothetical protein
MKETHHLLVYADNVNILGENKNPKKKNTESLLDTSEEDGLEAHRKLCIYCLTKMHSQIIIQ